jgi:hypothetical protein
MEEANGAILDPCPMVEASTANTADDANKADKETQWECENEVIIFVDNTYKKKHK